LSEIAVHLSDRAAPLFPPYAHPAQQAMIEQEREWKDSATGPFDPVALRRHVLRGGGAEAFFERGFADLIEKFDREQQALAAGTLHGGFGGVTYLVSGRKK
jgi:glycine cleavage system aminomethyltransferase T